LISRITVSEAICDYETSKIFRTIASTQPNTDILITHLKLTRKQYYRRISRLIKAGLVKRQNGRYFLTAFGKVICVAHIDLETKIQTALKDYWKLRAIDSMDISSREEHDSVVSTLIDNQEIKSILLK
jgi:predicted transcriptional regulator